MENRTCEAPVAPEVPELDDSGSPGSPAGAKETASPTAPLEWRWLLLGCLTHLAWGLYPVFARYLQVVLGFDGVLVLVVASSIAFLIVQLTTCGGLGGEAGVRIGVPYMLLTMGRSVTNMISAKFTIVLFVGLITTLGPFAVALLSRIVLNERLPRFFILALVAMTIGSLLTVAGQSNLQGVVLSGSDIIGMSIALLSIFISAGMRIFMKISSSSLSQNTLVSWQLMTALPMAGLASVATPKSAWQRLWHVSLYDISVMLAFSLTLFVFASSVQVSVVRRLGPSADASLQPLRLVSTIAAGYAVLGEPVRSAASWAGLTIIVAALTAYLAAQPRAARPSVCPAKLDPPGNGATKYGRVPAEQ